MIKDVEMKSLKTNVDDRGFLFVLGSAGREDTPNIPDMREVYVVGDFGKGIIRGFHKHHEMYDYFSIVHGSAKFVLVDDREDSQTYKEINTFVMSERNPSLLVVPPGVYHGWMALEERTIMVSIADKIYDKENPDEVRVAADAFGDVWNVKGR